MGCAGLSLAYRMSLDPHFKDAKVLLLDQDHKNKNDRTWCFWEKEEGAFESIVHKAWTKLKFKSADFSNTASIAPYAYKMIRGIDFYELVLGQLKKHPNFTIVFESITEIKECGAFAAVATANASYSATYVFNSALRPKIDLHSCNYVMQHFKGWVIETPEDTFDDTVATFMDFDIDQEGEARFFYVMPTTKREALVELAIFSNQLLDDTAYNALIKDYTEKDLGILDYKVAHQEFGIIPMTDYDFTQHQTAHIIQIGTPGGQVKPSSGYAFSRIQKHVKKILNNLKEEKHPAHRISSKARYRFYDRIFLNVVVKNRLSAPEIFKNLFKSNPTPRVLSFLSEETSLFEDLLLINSPPKVPFTKALFDELLF